MTITCEYPIQMYVTMLATECAYCPTPVRSDPAYFPRTDQIFYRRGNFTAMFSVGRTVAKTEEVSGTVQL